MKKTFNLYEPDPRQLRQPPSAAVTIDTASAHLRNRLKVYLEEFYTAEAFVLKLRGKTTQITYVPPLDRAARPDERLFRCWIGDQFVGTTLANSEGSAKANMKAHMVSLGYAKRACERLSAREAVLDLPTKDASGQLASGSVEQARSEISADLSALDIHPATSPAPYLTVPEGFYDDASLKLRATP